MSFSKGWNCTHRSGSCNISFLKNSLVQINSKLNEKNRMITYTNLVEGSLEYLEFPLLKFNCFQYSGYLFPKVFSCQISWNSNEWFSRNRRISVNAIFHSIAIFLTYYACAAFNWVLSVTKKKLRIAGFFASLPFLTYLCNKRLKPSIHGVQL